MSGTSVTITPFLGIEEPEPMKLGTLAPDAPDNPAAEYAVAGAGFSILGGILKGMSAIQSADFNADIADQNALVAKMAAGDARARGSIAAQMLLLRGSQVASSQKAAYANASVDASAGSAGEVQTDTKSMSAFDALMEENKAAREAWGLERRVDQFEEQAKLDRAAGAHQFGESILGGVSGVATAAMHYKLFS